MSIVFDLWAEDWNNQLHRVGSYRDYEEAQYEGLSLMNSHREVTHWHITVAGQKPSLPDNRKLPQSSLHNYYEFHEKVSA